MQPQLFFSKHSFYSAALCAYVWAPVGKKWEHVDVSQIESVPQRGHWSLLVAGRLVNAGGLCASVSADPGCWWHEKTSFYIRRTLMLVRSPWWAIWPLVSYMAAWPGKQLGALEHRVSGVASWGPPSPSWNVLLGSWLLASSYSWALIPSWTKCGVLGGVPQSRFP